MKNKSDGGTTEPVMKLLDKIPFWKSPMWFKLLLAKILVRCMTLENAPNEIILYNELRLYIETNGRPTTSNPNYWLNKDKPIEQLKKRSP